MIKNEVKTIKYHNGEIQRVQKIVLDDWDSLQFYEPSADKTGFDRICDLYENYIVPKAPYVFGTLVFFSIPEDIEVPFPASTKYGDECDKINIAAAELRKYAKAGTFEPQGKVKDFTAELKNRGLLRIVKGKRPLDTKILPISSGFGFLSSNNDSLIRVNSNFFVMDMFDVGSPYDVIGTPIGLRIKDGKILSPPLFNREALMVKNDGSISVKAPSIRDLSFEICGKEYVPGVNCKVFERPETLKTPKNNEIDLVIIGTAVKAVNKNGRTIIPSSGFVLRVENDAKNKIKPGIAVIYKGMEDVQFGIQAGNSAVINGKQTKGFISYFSNVKNLFSVNIPPSLYPHDYKKNRAPRTILGADRNGKPVILWIEGPGKNSYTKGKDSCGASLNETADICLIEGIYNGVNLDGGGSSQILLNGRRHLLISDRHLDGSEAERPIPIGLSVAKL